MDSEDIYARQEAADIEEHWQYIASNYPENAYEWRGEHGGFEEEDDYTDNDDLDTETEWEDESDEEEETNRKGLMERFNDFLESIFYSSDECSENQLDISKKERTAPDKVEERNEKQSNNEEKEDKEDEVPADEGSKGENEAVDEDEEAKKEGIVESFNKYLENIFSTSEEYDEEVEEELTAMYVLLWRILSGTVGIMALFIIVTKYPEYLSTLHENHLWFSNIKEVEREISFRTEQGLYYSYYKQILEAPTWTQGFSELLRDNRTEHGRTINIVHRFNILPEIVLSAMYKLLAPKDLPILYYVENVFQLHGIYLASLFMISWYLSSSCLAGVITSLLYVVHRVDSTRVNYTIPLRESFAIPLLFLQLLVMCSFLRSRRWQVVKVTGVFHLTMAFLLSWQFGPFVLLCQLFTLVCLERLQFIMKDKVIMLLCIIGGSLVMSCVIQSNPPLVISSPVISMLIPALMLSTTPPTNRRLSAFIRLFVAAAELALMLIATVLINGFVKKFLNIDADSHVYQLLLAKLQMGDSRDFDTRLYMCSEAFMYLDIDTLLRLSQSGLFPLYVVSILVFGISFTSDFFKTDPSDKYLAEIMIEENEVADVNLTDKAEMVEHKKVDTNVTENAVLEEKKDTDSHIANYAFAGNCENSTRTEECDQSHLLEDSDKSRFQVGSCHSTHSSNVEVSDAFKPPSEDLDSREPSSEVVFPESITKDRPDLALIIALSVLWSGLALMILRLKVLWLPTMCILCGIVVNDCRLYSHIFIRCHKVLSYLPRWFPAFCKVAISLSFAGFIIHKYRGQIWMDIWPEEVYEFWDPDTVDLMEWIQDHTPPRSVFAGSMQLLAGIKLCTGRHITNHPHYEDSWLRQRTHEIYQIYGRHSPSYVHQVLRSAGATHIILEDSICLAPEDPKHPLCKLTDIVDLHNGHVPRNGSQGIMGLKQASHERFCEFVRYDIDGYKKLFSLVMSNKTFRVYRIAIT